jgi:ferredoxin
MVIFYFSGTGNSRHIAQLFCKNTGAQIHSIEEDVDFGALIARHDTLAFCYPVYASCVPRPMREFVLRHADALRGKRTIIFCTQLLFSGDGARAMTAFLPDGAKNVTYAEHFNMPNNICNFPLFRVKNGEQNRRKLRRARRKMERVCADLENGVIRRRGFGKFSQILGKTQNLFWPAIEKRYASSARTDADCVRCGLCVRICPAGNLTLGGHGIEQHDNCVFCYRCVNACPQRAITVMFHKKPKRQYKGPSEACTKTE